MCFSRALFKGRRTRTATTAKRRFQTLQEHGRDQFRHNTPADSVHVIFQCPQAVVLIQWDCKIRGERKN